MADSWAAILPGIAGVIIALGGVLGQFLRNSPENINKLRARIDAAEERADKAEERATEAEERAADLATKVADLQTHMLSQGALLFNAQSILVAHGLMTQEQLENPGGAQPPPGAAAAAAQAAGAGAAGAGAGSGGGP